MKKYDIRHLIPQAEPFVMIDNVIFVEENSLSTELHIRHDNVFCENNKFQEAGLIEMMAQTAACLTGIRNNASGKTIETGYIGMIKNLNVYQLPKCGSTIVSTIYEVKQIMNVVIIKGHVKHENNLIAESEYRIYLQP